MLQGKIKIAKMLVVELLNSTSVSTCKLSMLSFWFKDSVNEQTTSLYHAPSLILSNSSPLLFSCKEKKVKYAIVSVGREDHSPSCSLVSTWCLFIACCQSVPCCYHHSTAGHIRHVPYRISLPFSCCRQGSHTHYCCFQS